MPGEDWRAVLTRPDGSLGFADFAQLVERATLADVPDIALPNAGRPMRWLDLLGWLARDHDCRYRVYNEWREPDADSGTGNLHRDDASFLLRLVMGLVDPHERPLIEAHRNLLVEQEQTKTRIGRLTRFIENTFPLLRTRLGLTEADCGDDQQFVGGLFATRAREKVTTQQRSLRRLSAELKAGSNVDALYQESVKAAQARAVAEKEFERVTGLKDHAATELKQVEQSSLADFYRTFAPTLNCPAQPCPLRPTPSMVCHRAGVPAGAADPPGRSGRAHRAGPPPRKHRHGSEPPRIRGRRVHGRLGFGVGERCVSLRPPPLRHGNFRCVAGDGVRARSYS